MAFIDNIVKFHTFSKSTVRNDLTLGEAVNPSGHTVTSSQVRTDDIPAFINSFQESKAAALTWAAANVDEHVRHNDILYYGANFNMGFNKPSCLIRVAKQVVDGKLVDLPADQHTWADFDLLSATTLANADGKDVIAIHKDAKICYVHTDNNAATNSNQNSAFVKKADGTFLDHFVAPTDQIIGGQPSLGYGLCLFLSGYNNGKAFSEGESTYIGNAYAGLIHFMTTRTESSDKSKNYEVTGFTVNCFEYIGDKLDTTLTDIDAKISKVVGDAFEGAVASVTASTATQNLGLTVSEGANPEITVTPGTISDAKLVTGSTVKTYVDTTALAEGGAIKSAISGAISGATLNSGTQGDNQIQTATGDAAGKLVTAAQVKEYVTENAQVTVTVGTTQKTSTGFEFAGSTGTDVAVAAAMDANGKVTYSATLSKADVAADGAVAVTDVNKVVSATAAEAIANKAISTSLTGTTDGTIGKAISDVEGLISGVSQTVAGIEASLATGGATAQAIADAQQAASDAMTEAQAKVASVTLGSTIPAGVSLGTDTKNPVLTIETVPSEGMAEGSTKLITAGVTHAIATYYADLAEGAAVTTINGKSLASLESSTQGSYVTVTTGGTIGTGLTVSVDDSGLASTVSAASTAIQTVKVNGTALTATNNAVDIILPKVKISGEEFPQHSHGFTVTTEPYSGASSNHYIRIAAAQYTPASGETAGSWVQGTTDYFTTASTVKTAIADAISGIDFPDVKVYGGSDDYGISFTTQTGEGAGSSHYMHIATAEYTASTDAWTNKGYLVTGATVESFVNDVVSEVSSDLTALENKVNAYHEAGVSYKVHDSQTLPDLSVAENVENYKNVILLVPTSSTGEASGDKNTAITGGYVEWLCVNKGTKDAPSWAWEQIGTTEADLHGYVNKISDGSSKDDSSRVSPVYASISSAGYLSLGIDSATSDKLGVSKLFSGHYTEMASVADKSNTAVSIATVNHLFESQEGQYAKNNDVVHSINGVQGALTLCVHNAPTIDNNTEGTGGTSGWESTSHANLWGMDIVSETRWDGSRVTLLDTFVGLTDTYLTTANLPSDAVSVENNFVYNAGGAVITTIRPERMVTGFSAHGAALQSWVGDLSNLTSSRPQTGSSYSVFYSMLSLNTFIGDLSSLTDGSGMFTGCSNLTTFISDLSSLTNGSTPSENDQGGMFQNTNLSLESVENIADTLPEHDGNITISWKSLPAEDKRQAFVDELSRIVDKGWTLYTNQGLLSLFDSEKYQTGAQTVEPKTRDANSEPITVYYVTKK